MADVIGMGKFLQRELQQVDSTWIQTVYPDYWATSGKYHRATPTLALGAKQVVAGRIDEVGDAAIYDGKASDIPLADFGVTEDAWKARIVIAGATWNVFDLAAAEMANRNAILPNRNFVETKMDAMKRAIDRRVHELVWAGDKKQGMQGLFSGSQVEVVTETTNLYALSTDDLYDYFIELIGDFQDDTLLTAEATAMMVPKPLHNRLMRRFTQNSDGTPYQLLTDPSRGLMVKAIVPINELKATFLEAAEVEAPGANKDRIIIGDLANADVVRREYYSMDRTEVTLGDDGITYRVTAYCATSEAQFRQPFRAKYLDIPKKV